MRESCSWKMPGAPRALAFLSTADVTVLHVKFETAVEGVFRWSHRCPSERLKRRVRIVEQDAHSINEVPVDAAPDDRGLLHRDGRHGEPWVEGGIADVHIAAADDQLHTTKVAEARIPRASN